MDNFWNWKSIPPRTPTKWVNFCEVNNLSRTKKIVFSNGAQKQKTLAGAGTLFRGGHLSPAQNVAIQCVCPPEGHQEENPLEKYGKISDLIPALLFSRRGDPSALCVYVFAIRRRRFRRCCQNRGKWQPPNCADKNKFVQPKVNSECKKRRQAKFASPLS